MYNEEKTIAVWLDYSKAHLITFNGGEPVIETLLNTAVPHLREAGEKSTGTTFGKYIGSNNEYSKHNQERDDIRYYYKSIAEALRPYITIHLFGPSTAKNELNNLMYDEKLLSNKVVTVNTAGKLTEKQMIAEARKLFDL